MNMVLTYFLFVLGFCFLIKGADLLVSGASSVAKKMKISNLVIGLTIVAFGTSAPELIVNLLAAFKGSSDLAISNVIGSNIANIFLILGVAAAICPLKVKSNTVWKEIPLVLLSVLLLFFMVNDAMLDGMNFNTLSRIDGISLLAFFVVFMYYSFGIAKNTNDAEGEKVDELSNSKSTIFIILGMLGLALGGQWIVEGAMMIAKNFGLTETLIGLTVVAIGTSLPELATSIVAARKGHADIAVGNVVGSNLFNVFWILGLSSTINPLNFNAALSNVDVIVSILAALLLFLFMFIGKKHILQRSQGYLFVLIYFSYITYLVLNA